jgi:hypothetical protein
MARDRRRVLGVIGRFDRREDRPNGVHIQRDIGEIAPAGSAIVARFAIVMFSPNTELAPTQHPC